MGTGFLKTLVECNYDIICWTIRRDIMKILTFFNNKGGVGKTTLTVNLASYLAKSFEKKILVLDADPQANTTQMIIPQENWIDFYGEGETKDTAKNLFAPIRRGDPLIDSNISLFKGTDHHFYFDVIPGDPSLSIIEDRLSEAWSSAKSGDPGGIRTTNWINKLFSEFNDRYDYLIVDVGTSLGALNRSILLNSDYIVTPMGSDIFSLMGIKNIASWIKEWRKIYMNGIKLFRDSPDYASIICEELINIDVEKKTLLGGYSIQQYNARKFKTGKRAVTAYDTIISQMPSTIEKELDFLIPSTLKNMKALNLGDVPYLNSIIPLAQSNNVPLFDLGAREGVRGQQYSNVKEFEIMIEKIAKNLLSNVGDSHA